MAFVLRIIKQSPAYFFSISYLSLRNRHFFSTLHHNEYHLFDKMHQRASSDFKLLVDLLKTKPRDPLLVASIHCISIKYSILLDKFFRTTLLTAYAGAEDSDSSWALFDEEAACDVILYNAIINTCLMKHDLRTCFDLFREMVKELHEFDSTTMVIVLSVVARARDVKQGAVLHGAILKRRFDFDTQLSNALINMYAKCGDLSSSEFVFADVRAKDITSWNSVINGSLFNGLPTKSALYFREMIHSSFQPDPISLSSGISACSFYEELHSLGKAIHGLVLKLGHGGIHGSSIENSLISFYSHSGDIEAAKEVFDSLFGKNIVSWNSMIGGLVENMKANEALQIFRELSSAMAMPPNAVTLIAIIPAIYKLDLPFEGKSVHAFAIRRQMEPSNPSLGNCLLDMYLKFDNFISAGHIFNAISDKDLVTWNTMILGYSKNPFLKQEARVLFCELLWQDLICSLPSLLAVLPSCTGQQDLNFGKSLHCWGLKSGLSSEVYVVNALMAMYTTCGDISASSQLLQSILAASDIVSWNTIIVGFVQNGHHIEGIKTFLSMHQSFDLQPDSITFVSSLSACGNLGLVHLGRSMHGLMTKCSAGSDLMARNALITMYFRFGYPENAELVFRTSKVRNLCSWNCMISGFTQIKDGKRALEFFKQMGGGQANEFSLVGASCACAQLWDLRKGREVHGYVIRSGMQSNSFIESALLDMYGKCGGLDISIRIFNNSYRNSVASWNSMISAFGLHGEGEKAIKLFSAMTQLGNQPTKSTFIALLSACSHSGLIEEGFWLYRRMKEEFRLEISTEHHVCVVEMLGKAGRIDEAFDFVRRSASKEDSGTWGALLSACLDHSNLQIGKLVAEHLFRLEPDNIGYYVTLSNLYADHGMWSNAEQVRSQVQDRGLRKTPGCSLIY
ncbi:Pentatricopeptide repeat-containing protein [Apostasia shenzhenica]|uniref:Pentatricopeptide repeat-containing protein n=1 Tax=Apostasia shenzhenica TaxID=1088818 RepID=A0A2I0BAK4_9ASPA|nr:Pentatricopeptide repeat-containing protein [Apostasia shenzhenica]